MVSQNRSRVGPPGATTPTPVTAVRLMILLVVRGSLFVVNRTALPAAFSGRISNPSYQRGDSTEPSFRIHMPHIRPGSQRPEVEDDKRFLRTLVHQPMFHVNGGV